MEPRLGEVYAKCPICGNAITIDGVFSEGDEFICGECGTASEVSSVQAARTVKLIPVEVLD